MKGGLGQMLKQAQQVQESLQRAQEELASLEVTGSAGGGVVTVTLNGRYQARAVRIDEAFVGGIARCWRTSSPRRSTTPRARWRTRAGNAWRAPPRGSAFRPD